MKLFFSLLTVATLSTAIIGAGSPEISAEQKAIASSDSSFFKAYATILRNRKEVIPAANKLTLVEQAQAKLGTVKAEQGSFNISKLGKVELALTTSALIWVLARTWQTYNFTPKAKEKDAAGKIPEKTWQEQLNDKADWMMIGSNAMLACVELYKAATSLNKGKEAVAKAEKVLSKIEKLPAVA